MRLFIAVDLSDAARAWALERRNEFQARWPESGLRWTSMEQWHVTLQFLGDCSERQLLPIQAAMKHAVAGVTPFSITFGKPGLFSGPRMGVLWLGVESGSETLTELVSSLRESLQAAGFKKEKQPYRGHLTLARSRTKIPSHVLRLLPPSSPCPEIPISSMTLYRSTLDSTGARYDVVYRLCF